MRITGGSLRGRLVSCPPGSIRPAMDRMRESFFSILGDIGGLSFLDLFAGSGIMGLEAYSRGAGEIVAVEKDGAKRRALMQNAALAGSALRVFIMPAERYVMSARRAMDLVFCDPPFPYRFKTELIEKIASSRLLAPGGRLFIHYPAEEDLPEATENLVCYDRRAYGRSHIRFYLRPLS